MPRAATIAWTVTCLAVLGAAACGDGGPGTGTPDAIRDVPADVATPDAVDDATEPRDTPTELPHDDLAASDDGEDCGPGCGDEAPGDEDPRSDPGDDDIASDLPADDPGPGTDVPADDVPPADSGTADDASPADPGPGDDGPPADAGCQDDACAPVPCGDRTCPWLAGFTARCNDHLACEYANPDATGWKAHDVWIEIAPGTFAMGAPADEADSADDERPVHDVTFAAPYLIAKYEATTGAYAACVADGACTAAQTFDPECNGGRTGRDDHPINCLTWTQASAFCAWTGGRLCSESEWERAATGDTHRRYPWGDAAATCDLAVMHDEAGDGCGTGGTMPVGSKPAGASPWGVLDMTGNVWESLEDDWHDNYDGAPVDGTPWIDDPRNGYRVDRGGGLDDTGAYLRLANRGRKPRIGYAVIVGTRCCMTP
jgi:formylglycine-generating enzyme required for sulfatase activity